MLKSYVGIASRNGLERFCPDHPEVTRFLAIQASRLKRQRAVLVLSDAARVEWKLGKRTGTARPGTLKIRAPLQPGRYTLTVTANGFSDRAAVIVRAPKQ